MDVTPLMKAVRCGNLEETRELLKSGADLTKRSPFGIDLLVLACASGNRDIVHAIYQELEKVGVEGSPDLGLAVRTAVLFDHESVLDFLIKQKCDLDDRDKDSGVTALMLAVCNGSTRMVSVLLRHGVDPHIRNKLGQTALDVAAVRKRPGIIPLLERSSTPLAHRRTRHLPVLKFKIPLITRTKESPHGLEICDAQKVSTPNCAGVEAYDMVFSSPVSPIKGDPTRRLSSSPLKLQDNVLYPSSQMMTTRSGSSSDGSFKRLKIDLTGLKVDTSSLSPEFGYQSGPSGSHLSLSPQHYSYDVDGPSRRNLTFSEKIDLLDKLEPNAVRERHSKPLWRSLSNRLQVIRKKRRRSGYLLRRQGHTTSTSISTSHPGFSVRKEEVEYESYWKGSEAARGGYDAVSDILRLNNLGQYVPVFKEHEMDLATLACVTDGDLQEMCIADQRHRRDLLWIAHLIKTSSRQQF